MRIEIARKAFGETVVLSEFSLSLDDGEAVAVLGPSGIGKTTLLRIAAGLDTSFDGAIGGAGRVTYVFQEPTLLPWRTLAQNLAIATGCTAAEASDALTTVGLAGMEDRFPGTLSLGQARRASIARAFLTRPDTLLLDEPFASLDSAATQKIIDLLLAFRATHRPRMLLVTHDEEIAEKLCDRAVRLGSQAGS